MTKINTLIIGAGASGIVAAINAKYNGDSILLCDRMPKIGKKILACGAGKCNLLNEKLDESFYKPQAQSLVKSIFSKTGKDRIINFFDDLGLKTCSQDGRIFPITNQASSVLKVLEMELTRLKIPLELNFEVMDIMPVKDGFKITSRDADTVECNRVIIATGGKSYPALGSNGSGYALAASLGHTVTKPVPSAVPLVVKDPLCHVLQGQKIPVKIKAVIDNKTVSQASGDLLFTKYGLSGTAIIDISDAVSIAINRLGKKNVSVVLDLVPFLDEAGLAEYIKNKIAKGVESFDLLAGILPNKIALAFDNVLKNKKPEVSAQLLKAKIFQIISTRGWNEAEFTNGGIEPQEIDPGSLESKIRKGIYFCGEIIDVGAKRGGYNLAWAWASGFVAGMSFKK